MIYQHEKKSNIIWSVPTVPRVYYEPNTGHLRFIGAIMYVVVWVAKIGWLEKI